MSLRRILLAAFAALVTSLISSPALAVYNADLGRWMTRDPAGYVDGASLYEYGRPSPVNATDPFGLAAGIPDPSLAHLRDGAWPGYSWPDWKCVGHPCKKTVADQFSIRSKMSHTIGNCAGVSPAEINALASSCLNDVLKVIVQEVWDDECETTLNLSAATAGPCKCKCDSPDPQTCLKHVELSPPTSIDKTCCFNASCCVR